MKKILLGLAIVIAFIISQRWDSFYDYYLKEYDLYRLPLIKPYEIYCSGFDIWSVQERCNMDFGGSSFLDLPINIDSLGVKDNKIVFYCNNRGMGPQEQIYIFDVNNHKGIVVEHKDSFDNYILSNKIKMYKTIDVFKTFQKENKLTTELDSLVIAENRKQWWKIKNW